MSAQTPFKPGEKIVTVHEAKTHLSRLLAEVEAGGEIVLARGKTPVARIVPLERLAPKRRVPGRLAHLVPPGKKVLEDGFWDPLKNEEMGMGDEEGVLEKWGKGFSSTPTR